MAASFGRSLRPMAPLGNTHVSADRRVDTSSTFHPSASIRTGTQPTCVVGEGGGRTDESRNDPGGGEGRYQAAYMKGRRVGHGSNSTSGASKQQSQLQPISPPPAAVVPAATLPTLRTNTSCPKAGALPSLPRLGRTVFRPIGRTSPSPAARRRATKKEKVELPGRRRRRSQLVQGRGRVAVMTRPAVGDGRTRHGSHRRPPRTSSKTRWARSRGRGRRGGVAECEGEVGRTPVPATDEVGGAGGCLSGCAGLPTTGQLCMNGVMARLLYLLCTSPSHAVAPLYPAAADSARGAPRGATRGHPPSHSTPHATPTAALLKPRASPPRPACPPTSACGPHASVVPRRVLACGATLQTRGERGGGGRRSWTGTLAERGRWWARCMRGRTQAEWTAGWRGPRARQKGGGGHRAGRSTRARGRGAHPTAVCVLCHPARRCGSGGTGTASDRGGLGAAPPGRGPSDATQKPPHPPHPPWWREVAGGLGRRAPPGPPPHGWTAFGRGVGGRGRRTRVPPLRWATPCATARICVAAGRGVHCWTDGGSPARFWDCRA